MSQTTKRIRELVDKLNQYRDNFVKISWHIFLEDIVPYAVPFKES